MRILQLLKLVLQLYNLILWQIILLGLRHLSNHHIWMVQFCKLVILFLQLNFRCNFRQIHHCQVLGYLRRYLKTLLVYVWSWVESSATAAAHCIPKESSPILRSIPLRLFSFFFLLFSFGLVSLFFEFIEVELVLWNLAEWAELGANEAIGGFCGRAKYFHLFKV